MDRLQQMAVFASVVEAGSFSEAARRLGLAKSTVSKRIAELEERLGARLVNRTTRRLALTDPGRAFYARCARMLAEAEEAELAVSRLQHEPAGVLRLNAPVSFGRARLAPLLPAFLARHPAVSVELTLEDRFVDLLEEGYDLAVRITGRMADSSLVARRLASTHLVVCGSPSYLAARGVPRTPAELSAHACLLYSYQATSDAWVLTGPGGEETVRVSGPLRANNGDALLEAALGGAGLVLLPDFIVGAAVREGRLQRVLEGWRGPGTAVWAVYPHSRHLSAKVRAFVDHLAEHLAADGVGAARASLS